MIIPFMTQAQRNEARAKSLEGHIKDLEMRHSEPDRREAIALLEDLLAARVSEIGSRRLLNLRKI